MADIDADAIWALSDALAVEPTTAQRTASATVSRIDNDGTIWVRLAGAESATPVNGGCTVEVEPNDAVTVRIENGRCAITGSTSKPATNSEAVESRVAPVEGAAMDAKSEATAARKIANEAASVAAATGQYFWHDANGAHVSIEAQNPIGASNSVWNSLGLLIRKAANNLVSITASAIAFFDGNGNASSNVVASFGSSGVQIGKETEAHLLQTSTDTKFFDSNGIAQAKIECNGTDVKIVNILTSDRVVLSSTGAFLGANTGDGISVNGNDISLLGDVYINSNQLTDFVVEQGTSGIWTYRKWNSGAAECWGIYTASIAITTSAAGYGGYRSAQITAPNFPFTFTATPAVTMTGGAGFNGCWVNNMQGTNGTRAQFYLSCGQSNAATNRSLHIQAMGKWK